MAIFAQASQPFTASASGAGPGLVGTIGVQVVDAANGAVSVPRTTADITEILAGSGVYLWRCPAAPSAVGDYEIIWDTGGGTPAFASEDLSVTLAAPVTAPGDSGPPQYPTISTLAAQSQQAQRAVRGRPFTAGFIFGLDGDPLPDADTTVTVTVVNAAGYLIESAAAATLGTPSDSVQSATLALPASSLADRDRLTCLWALTVGGEQLTAISQIDVCDARLFTLAQARAYPELPESKYTDAQVEQARFDAENFLEWQCGCAFTGRYGIESFSLPEAAGWGGAGRRGTLQLGYPFVQGIRDVTIDGTPVADPTTVSVNPRTSVVSYSSGFSGAVTIGFEHGRPVPDAGRVALILARYRLLNGPLDSRAISQSVEGGGTISLLTPGVRGSVTGIPEVDAFIGENSHQLGYVS